MELRNAIATKNFQDPNQGYRAGGRPYVCATTRFAAKLKAKEEKRKQREAEAHKKNYLSRNYEPTKSEKERGYRLREFCKHRDIAYSRHYLPDINRWSRTIWTGVESRMKVKEL